MPGWGGGRWGGGGRGGARDDAEVGGPELEAHVPRLAVGTGVLEGHGRVEQIAIEAERRPRVARGENRKDRGEHPGTVARGRDALGTKAKVRPAVNADLHDAVWAAVPADATPERYGPRRAFLLAHVGPGDTVLDLG